jgi:peptidoglycan DL-endopeptidase LytE
VRAGDSLSKLATSYGTTVRALMDLNGLRSTVIQIGQVLRIPS